MNTIHKKIDWVDRLEIAGAVLQIVIACLVMAVLAYLASQTGFVWQGLF